MDYVVSSVQITITGPVQSIYEILIKKKKNIKWKGNFLKKYLLYFSAKLSYWVHMRPHRYIHCLLVCYVQDIIFLMGNTAKCFIFSQWLCLDELHWHKRQLPCTTTPSNSEMQCREDVIFHLTLMTLSSKFFDKFFFFGWNLKS